MIPRLRQVRSRDVVHVLKKLGFTLDRQSGSHAIYYRNTDKRRAVVPVHGSRTVKPKTLSAIVKDMGLAMDEFEAML
jgi:predicted RNA binding protein YcfA (HicA-like mRNA interferase family)